MRESAIQCLLNSLIAKTNSKNYPRVKGDERREALAKRSGGGLPNGELRYYLKLRFGFSLGLTPSSSFSLAAKV